MYICVRVCICVLTMTLKDIQLSTYHNNVIFLSVHFSYIHHTYFHKSMKCVTMQTIKTNIKFYMFQLYLNLCVNT